MEIYLFSSMEGVIDELHAKNMDVFLADSSFEIEDHLIPKKCGFAYLVGSQDIETVRGQRTICKYQKAELIYKEILSIYSENVSDILGFKADNGSTRLDEGIAYVSSSGKISTYEPGKAVITAVAKDGSGTQASTTIYVTPKAPSTLYLGKATTSSIKSSWYSVSGADGYTVYRKVGKTWRAIKNTSATSYTVKKLSAGTGYQFRVRAFINADGKKYSPYSSIVKLATNPKKTTIKSIKKLKKKTNRYGTYYRAKVSWKKVSGATSYRVYYKANGSSYKSLVGTYKKTSATIQLYRSRYSSGTKKYTFYVVPVKTYDGRNYSGAYSKGKKYTFK